MHAGNTLGIMTRMVIKTEFTIEDYCSFDSLVTGLERDIREWGEGYPMPAVRQKLNSARKYFQDGCGFGDNEPDTWDRIRTFAGQDLYALQSEFLTDDGRSFKRPTE
jgi:hypothetical protein